MSKYNAKLWAIVDTKTGKVVWSEGHHRCTWPTREEARVAKKNVGSSRNTAIVKLEILPWWTG